MSTTSIPTQIKALLQPHTQVDDLVLTELPIQLVRDGTDEHLIKVYATSPCSGELAWARRYPSIMEPDRVAVPCGDLSGIVVAAPPNSPFQPGTEVYTRTPAGRTGNAREYSIALTSELAIKPKVLSWEEAASIPLSFFTAYQLLFEHGGLKASWKNELGRKENAKKRILVTGASGGVGVWVVQLARAAGAQDIIAVTGPTNVEFVKSLGASEVVNYREQSLGKWALGKPKVDLVVDMIGKQTLADAWTAVRDGGILLSVNEPPENQKPGENAPKDVTNYFFIMKPLGWQLAEIADLLEKGEVKAVVDSVWKLEEFKHALAKLEGGHARGKIVIKVQDA